jgi:hypothetical protein
MMESIAALLWGAEMDSKTVTTKREAAKERLRKRKEYLVRVGLALQRGTILDPRSWIWLT